MLLKSTGRLTLTLVSFSSAQNCCKKQNFSPHGSPRQLTTMAENNIYINFVMVTSIQQELNQDILSCYSPWNTHRQKLSVTTSFGWYLKHWLKSQKKCIFSPVLHFISFSCCLRINTGEMLSTNGEWSPCSCNFLLLINFNHLKLLTHV